MLTLDQRDGVDIYLEDSNPKNVLFLLNDRDYEVQLKFLEFIHTSDASRYN